jgi:hypothetical protein
VSGIVATLVRTRVSKHPLLPVVTMLVRTVDTESLILQSHKYRLDNRDEKRIFGGTELGGAKSYLDIVTVPASSCEDPRSSPETRDPL